MLDILIKYAPKILDGVYLTLELVFISVIMGLIIAIPLGISLTSKNKFINTIPRLYVFFIRGTPLIVQLALVYYGLAQFEAVRKSFLWVYLKSPYWCALTVMTIHTAAYIAEIIRGSINAVPSGEIEAASSLGMQKWQTLLFVILPRAARFALPAYSNEVILMLKASSLASTITLMELTGVTKTIIARTYMAIEFYSIIAIIYLLITCILVFTFRLIEKKISIC